MNLDEQRQRYRALDDWFQTPQGRYLEDALVTKCRRFKHFLNPHVLLQIGSCGHNALLSLLSCRHRWIVTPCRDARHTTLVASPTHLPLQSGSVDVVIAPMLLEIFGRSTCPFDEIDRVLHPMGYIVFWGINPVSLWGLALACYRLSLLGQVRMRPHMPWTIKYALLNRGYQQRWFDAFYDVPPFRRETWIKNSAFLNEVGKIVTIIPPGFYLLVMQKYQAHPVVLETQRQPLVFNH